MRLDPDAEFVAYATPREVKANTVQSWYGKATIPLQAATRLNEQIACLLQPFLAQDPFPVAARVLGKWLEAPLSRVGVQADHSNARKRLVLARTDERRLDTLMSERPPAKRSCRQ